MAQADFSLSIEIPAPLEGVREFLADLHRIRVLHPLIVGVDDLPANPARPAARQFQVFDRLKLGPLPLRIRYRAEIEVTSADEVRGTAWQFPAIEVRTRYQLAPLTGDSTRLTERVDMTAPRLLIGTVRRQALAAHQETLEKLARHLSTESAATI